MAPLELPIDRLRNGHLTDAETLDLAAEIIRNNTALGDPQRATFEALAERIRLIRLADPRQIRARSTYWPGEQEPKSALDKLSPAHRAAWVEMADEMKTAERLGPPYIGCGCGYPKKPCLRVVLGNGPPFPERPCEPERTS